MHTYLIIFLIQSSSFSYRDVLDGKVTFAMTSNSHSTDILHLNVKYNRIHGSSIGRESEMKIIVKSDIFTSMLYCKLLCLMTECKE